MKVILADTAVTVEGWLDEMDAIGAYKLRVRKTPQEIKAEKERAIARFGRSARKIKPIRIVDGTVISKDASDPDTAYFLPGLWPRVRDWLDSRSIQYELEDCRNPQIRPEIDYGALAGVRFRENQDVALALIATADCGVIETATAWGKCMAGDTKVLMFDGSMRMAKDVRKDDLLMGDDSTPRKVLSVSSGHGMMYRFRKEDGTAYRFNGNHMLTLANGSDEEISVMGKRLLYGQLVDISVSDYLKQPDELKKPLMACTTAVEFHRQEQPEYNPYLLGFETAAGRHPPEIPAAIKYGSLSTRRRYIAGLIDGGYSSFQGFELFLPWLDTSAEDLLFTARSAGITAVMRPPQTDAALCVGFIDGLRYIPSQRLKKLGVVYLDPPASSSMSLQRFTIREDGEDDYYGFCLDGNHRYLLEDFTVTHNSFLISVICKAFPSLNILVCTSSASVVGTLYEYLCKQLPGQIGVLCGGKDTTRGKRVVVSTLKSLPKIPAENVQLVLVDECHDIGDNQAGRTLMQFCFARRFGFSASPLRNDGSQLMLESVLGPTILKMTYEESVEAGMVTPMKYLMIPCPRGPSICHRTDLDDVIMRRFAYWNNTCRNMLVRDFVYDLKKVYNGQILIMVGTLEHAIRQHLLLPWFRVAYYGATDMDDIRRRFPADKYPRLDLSSYKITQRKLEIMRNAFAKGTQRYVISTTVFKQGEYCPAVQGYTVYRILIARISM